ncbi:MAG: hypothetical protein ABIR70_09555 [Bryobacteraceae bacterium]
MAVDKKAGFAPAPAATYPGHQTQDKIIIAAKPYNTDELAATAFGKVKPHARGILPVLVVIQNDTGKGLRLDLTAEFVTASGEHLEAMTPDDVVRFQGIQKRPGTKSSLPRIPGLNKAPKGPLNTPEIEGRAFLAKLLPPGESINGFFYFQADELKGAQLYLSGIKDAATNQSFFYFELPLDAR